MRTKSWSHSVIRHYVEKPVNVDVLDEMPKYIEEEKKVKRVGLREFKFNQYPATLLEMMFKNWN